MNLDNVLYGVGAIYLFSIVFVVLTTIKDSLYFKRREFDILCDRLFHEDDMVKTDFVLTVVARVGERGLDELEDIIRDTIPEFSNDKKSYKDWENEMLEIGHAFPELSAERMINLDNLIPNLTGD